MENFVQKMRPKVRKKICRDFGVHKSPDLIAALLGALQSAGYKKSDLRARYPELKSR